MLCLSICQRLKCIYVVSLLLPIMNSSLLTAVTIESSTENIADGTSISTSVINRSNKIIRNPTIPKPTIRVDNHSNRDGEKNGDRSKQLLVALSSKSYISKPNATAPTPVKLTKRAGSAAEIKHKKITKENLNRTGDIATRGKLRQEPDHIPDSSGHIPYRINRPHLGLSGYESAGVSSSSNDGGDDYHNLSYESDKWPSDYWERDYNKNFLYNNTRVHHIEAECQDDYMKIRIGFNATFNGLIYSAGYAYDPDCMYINGSGRDYYEFFIQLNRCGTLGKNALHEEKRKNPTNFMWNTVTVQYNPLIEEEYDEHFKVTCEYGYDFWKTVTFPFLDVEVATGNPVVFTLSPPECYMEIQNGYGIGGPRVTGPVRVGDPLTLIIYMRSKYDGFDIVVNDCYAHNGANKKIQLIDEYGCPVDDKLISRFRGSWSDSGIFETQVYAYMKTFRFTGSPALYIECDVRMCHGRCPSQPCHWRNSKTVSKRDISNSTALNLQSALDSTASEVEKTNSSQNSGNSLAVDIMAISNSDKQPASLSENLNLFQSLRVLQEGESDGNGFYPHSRRLEPQGNQTCMKTTTLSALTIILSVTMFVLSGTLVVTCSRLKRRSKDASLYETYITHKGQID
ncbi:uncharacterized protein LOC105232777 [Bactrocera dorsalis]|uniref:Uncharacterized protein LOC105232777 n=1 Tax=Bactrocera dorsalis TaxID=27457 RepID=A0A034WWG7_BACDO|nr:uncharacterized protein LOC105232777 [Bactrocera dorsalis]XP_019848213.1 uncharacterized protein LOC105232777 [Bactrocera dorsalis]